MDRCFIRNLKFLWQEIMLWGRRSPEGLSLDMWYAKSMFFVKVGYFLKILLPGVSLSAFLLYIDYCQESHCQPFYFTYILVGGVFTVNIQSSNPPLPLYLLNPQKISEEIIIKSVKWEVKEGWKQAVSASVLNRPELFSWGISSSVLRCPPCRWFECLDFPSLFAFVFVLRCWLA